MLAYAHYVPSSPCPHPQGTTRSLTSLRFVHSLSPTIHPLLQFSHYVRSLYSLRPLSPYRSFATLTHSVPSSLSTTQARYTRPLTLACPSTPTQHELSRICELFLLASENEPVGRGSRWSEHGERQRQGMVGERVHGGTECKEGV